MNTRPATEADEAVLRELWEEFEAEVPDPPGIEPPTWEAEWASMRESMSTGAVYLAADGEGAVGFAEAHPEGPKHVRVEIVYVRPRGRSTGVAKTLLREIAGTARTRGAELVTLEVLESNALAREVWGRLGFEPVAQVLAQSLDSLEARLEDRPDGPSRASTHVQTDDRLSVERALRHFVPRPVAAEVRETADGWIRIADPLFDTDREAQSRLAAELSDALGAVVVALAIEIGSVVRFRLYESGRMVDEYLSVPGFYGPISKGDELALAANPTLVSRLTGADRDEVRRGVRTAATAGELPPAETLYTQIAGIMGLEP